MLGQGLINEISGLLLDSNNQECHSILIESLRSICAAINHTDLRDKRRHIAGLISAAFAAESRPLPKCGTCGGTGSKDKVPHLLNDLRKRGNPIHLRTITVGPGPAGNGRRWVCPLCPTSKWNAITARSNDMRTHLQDVHGYLPEHVAYVFDTSNEDALFKYFGPYEEDEAIAIGLRVRAYKKNAITMSKRVKTGTKQIGMVPAVPDLNETLPTEPSRTKLPGTAGLMTKESSTQTGYNDGGTTLVDSATASTKTNVQRYSTYADACKSYGSTSGSDLTPNPAGDVPMDTSQVGEWSTGWYPEHFEESFQNGDYQSSGHSSGQNSIHLDLRSPPNSSLHQPPMAVPWHDPHRSRFLND